MKENKINISEDLSLSESKELLRSLKLYEDLWKKLWNRGEKLFKSISSWKSIYKIEYFENASKKDAIEEWLIAFKKVFWETPKVEEITLEARKALAWGIRIYKDDNLLDLSFKKAEDALK